jgi:hypothetical protein
MQCLQRGDWRAAFLQRLSEHLQKERAAADIRVAIIRAVGDWMEGREPEMNTPQNAIGWEQLLRGHVAEAFARQQEAFFRRLNFRKGRLQRNPVDTPVNPVLVV